MQVYPRFASGAEVFIARVRKRIVEDALELVVVVRNVLENVRFGHAPNPSQPHAREFTMAMENAITHSLTAANMPLEQHVTMRARVIFRRPSFVGDRYLLRARFFRRDAETMALGAFHGAGGSSIDDENRAAVFLRFEGRLL